MSGRSKPNEIRITRVYDAPVRMVWDAWTDLDQVVQWWGPRGFTLTTHSKDLRPGGTWIYTMHGPDGTDYPNLTTYHEVEECRRLVYDHGASEGRPPLFRVTATFSESNGKTTLDMTMALATPEAAAETRRFIKSAGGNGTWDRLAEHLEKRVSGHEQFVIHRSFEAPVAKVFEMWTKPEHIAQWLPPTGFRMEHRRADVREGGESFYMMTNDAGVTMYGRIRYLEISPTSRLVYEQQFCDEKENLSKHPALKVWPATMHTTVTFTEEAPDETRVRVVWEPSAEATAEEIAAFVGMRPSMTGGWTGSFDKLDEVLAR
jgi:uncharacterized protein YndB with AHSA1/START domain